MEGSLRAFTQASIEVLNSRNDGNGLSGEDLRGADLSGLDLAGLNFENANLSGARLTGCRLDLTNFSGANLEGADLIGVVGNRTFLSANLTRARLRDAELTDSTVTVAYESDFTHARLRGCDLGHGCKYASMTAATLSECRWGTLAYADVRRAQISHCHGAGHWWVVNEDTVFESFAAEAVTFVLSEGPPGSLLSYLVWMATQQGAYVRSHYDDPDLLVVKAKLDAAASVRRLGAQTGRRVIETDTRVLLELPKGAVS